MTEVGSTYSIKYKMTMTMIIIVVVVVPCPSLSSWSLIVVLVPRRRSASPVSVCGCWPLFVGCGGWWSWAVVCFLGVAAVFVLAIICVRFGGLSSFLGGRERLSVMVVRWRQRGGRAVVGRHWGRCWCGGSGGGGGG